MLSVDVRFGEDEPVKEMDLVTFIDTSYEGSDTPKWGILVNGNHCYSMYNESAVRARFMDYFRRYG